MRCVAVLVQIDALPGSEYGTTAGDWNRKAGLGEGRANVGRHVVRSFYTVAIESRISGNQSPEKVLQIMAHIRVGILLDGQGSRRVADVQGQETSSDLLSPGTNSALRP